MDSHNPLPRSVLESQFQNEKTSDIQFRFPNEHKCKCENCGCNEPKSLAAHRMVLAGGSSVFYDKFYGPNSAGEPTINITEYASCIFREFLQIFYLQNVQFTPAHTPHVIRLLTEFDVKDSVNVVEQFMIKSISVENCLTYMDITMAYASRQRVQSPLREFIGNNATEVLKTTAFRQCPPYMVKVVLQMNTLKCTEAEVFDAVMEWGKEACIRQNIEVTDRHQRRELGDFFYLIRFPTMTVEMFMACLKKYPRVLNDHEMTQILEVLMHQIPLGEGSLFSGSPRIQDESS